MTFFAPYGGAEGAGDEPPRPPVVREHVVASKSFFEANNRAQIVQAAAAIFTKHWGDISQFMLGQRQMGIVLPASYKRKHFGDMTMEYQRLGNQETLLLTAYPDAASPNPQGLIVDLNFDGYVAWIHHQNVKDSTINGKQNIVGPFDIFFNGYLIEQDFAPTKGTGGYVLLFGATALKAQSYQDDQGRHKNELINSNPKDAAKAVAPRPGWGTFPDGQSPTGAAQNKLTKELGYWIFDFTNTYNPCNYIYTQGQWQTWAQVTVNDGLTIQLSKGLWFEKAEKSPLDYKGPNNQFGIVVSPRSIVSEVVVNGVFIAEFYDRNKQRTVKSSWRYDGSDGQFVSINDSPLLWGAAYNTGGFFEGAGIGFDLTPKADKPDGSGSLLGPHDGIQGADQQSGGLTGLSDQDLAKLKAWRDTVAQMQNDYVQSVQQFVDAWSSKWSQPSNVKELNQARNVEAWFLTVSDANGNRLPPDAFNPLDRAWAIGVGGRPEFGPVQEYWWDWNTPQGTGLRIVSARWLAFFSVVDQRVEFIDTSGTAPNPASYGGSFAGPSSPTSIDALFTWAKTWIKTDAVARQLDEYNQIFKDHPPPTFPDRPRIGKDYRDFSYRAITISGGDWRYPAKFSGD